MSSKSARIVAREDTPAPTLHPWWAALAGALAWLPRLLRSRTAAEHLLAGAALAAGLIMMLNGPISGVFGLVAGMLLAAEVYSRRPSPWLALPAIAAIGVSSGTSAGQRDLILGLMNIAALTLPLRRGLASTLFLTQMLFLIYVGYFAVLEMLTDDTVPWREVIMQLIVFNVISTVGYELAAGRRKVEVNLERETQHARDLARALERAEILRSAIGSVREELNAEQVLRVLVEEVREIMNPDFCQVLLPDGAETMPELSTIGRARWPLGSDSDEIPPEVRTLFAEPSPLWLTEPLSDRAQHWLQLPPQVRSLGLLPIVATPEVACVLELAWFAPQNVVESDRQIVAALVEQAVTAIERAAFRAELAERAFGAETLHSVSARIVGLRDVNDIARDAIQALRTMYHADAGVFYLIDREQDTYCLINQEIAPARFQEMHREYSGGRRGQGLHEGRSMIVQYGGSDRRNRLRELMAAEGIQTLIEVPAVAEERTLGGIALYHRRPRLYRPYEVQLLETFAQQLAGGMELAQAYRRVEETDRQREEFLSLVSHELRHPVAAMGTVAEALVTTPGLGEIERRALEGLRQQAHSLALLAEDVLSVAQLESGQFRMRPIRFNLGDLIGSLCRQAPQPDRIVAEVPSDPIILEADPERVGQAFDNLVRNALKYSEQGTLVNVRVRGQRVEERVVIEVQDNGVGFDPSEFPALFQKYGRLRNTSTSEIKGIGLGLYLSRLIVEAHGGNLRAASPGRGRGATFGIELPWHPEVDA